MSVGIAKEVELRPKSAVQRALDDVGDDEILIELTAQRVAGGLLFRMDAEQKSGETDVP